MTAHGEGGSGDKKTERQEERKTWKENINITDKTDRIRRIRAWKTVKKTTPTKSTHHHTHTHHENQFPGMQSYTHMHTDCYQPTVLGWSWPECNNVVLPVLGCYPHDVPRPLVWTAVLRTRVLHILL